MAKMTEFSTTSLYHRRRYLKSPILNIKMEGHKDDKEPGTSPLSGKAKRPGIVQPGEKKTEGESD